MFWFLLAAIAPPLGRIEKKITSIRIIRMISIFASLLYGTRIFRIFFAKFTNEDEDKSANPL